MKYTVLIREIHISHREIEADSLEEAVRSAPHNGKEILLEYSHTPDMQITVYDGKTNEIITEDAR